MARTTSTAAGSVERIVEEVSAWPGVRAEPHRFGGTEFLLGDREIGHVHRFGIVDINFPKRLRDALVAAGKTGEHHVVPDSGWTTLYLETPADGDRGLWLLRLSYMYLALVLGDKPGGREALAGVDVEAELAALELDDALRAPFESVLARR
jgi:hypothetical protein